MVKAVVSPRRWPRRLTQIVFGLAAAALVVGGVVAVGNVARDSLGPHDRYLLAFNEIECPAPPGQDRAELLRTTLVPQARQTFDVSRMAYQADKIDFQAVIENERTGLPMLKKK